MRAPLTLIDRDQGCKRERGEELDAGGRRAAPVECERRLQAAGGFRELVATKRATNPINRDRRCEKGRGRARCGRATAGKGIAGDRREKLLEAVGEESNPKGEREAAK